MRKQQDSVARLCECLQRRLSVRTQTDSIPSPKQRKSWAAPQSASARLSAPRLSPRRGLAGIGGSAAWISVPTSIGRTRGGRPCPPSRNRPLVSTRKRHAANLHGRRMKLRRAGWCPVKCVIPRGPRRRLNANFSALRDRPATQDLWAGPICDAPMRSCRHRLCVRGERHRCPPGCAGEGNPFDAGSDRHSSPGSRHRDADRHNRPPEQPVPRHRRGDDLLHPLLDRDRRGRPIGCRSLGVARRQPRAVPRHRRG